MEPKLQAKQPRSAMKEIREVEDDMLDLAFAKRSEEVAEAYRRMALEKALEDLLV